MRCAHGDDYRHVSELETSPAMVYRDRCRPLLLRFLGYLDKLLERHFRVRIVLQKVDIMVIGMVANRPFERDDSARLMSPNQVGHCGSVEGRLRHHEPTVGSLHGTAASRNRGDQGDLGTVLQPSGAVGLKLVIHRDSHMGEEVGEGRVKVHQVGQESTKRCLFQLFQSHRNRGRSDPFTDHGEELYLNHEQSLERALIMGVLRKN